ncbi:MAG: 4Fe-4S binding protein [Spirochaetales bacterium]|jgi:NAD-dependent dihydropyrimidine dehydrogenase PreA subunit
MANRTIIERDQGKCNGCGLCETGCPEGALKVIAGKARLVGESLCDGLGACIGRCPQDAIRFIEKDAADYDEIAVLKEILPQGAATLRAHFDHLDSHGQDLYLSKAVEYLNAQGISIPAGFERFGQQKPFVFSKPSGQSSLKNWPIQLHLANPKAANFETADLVIAADCTAFALGSFHADIMTEKSLVIACPKLDSGKDLYVSKLSAMLKQARSVSVILMEVPCCSGLLKLAQEARTLAGSNITLNVLVVGIDGGFVAQSAK